MRPPAPALTRAGSVVGEPEKECVEDKIKQDEEEKPAEKCTTPRRGTEINHVITKVGSYVCTQVCLNFTVLAYTVSFNAFIVIE